MTDVEKETRLTQEEEKILKQARDITEKKRKESKRLSEKWTEQESRPTRREEKRRTRERKTQEISDLESSSEDPRLRRR